MMGSSSGFGSHGRSAAHLDARRRRAVPIFFRPGEGRKHDLLLLLLLLLLRSLERGHGAAWLGHGVDHVLAKSLPDRLANRLARKADRPPCPPMFLQPCSVQLKWI
jgi:hypothetical protein